MNKAYRVTCVDTRTGAYHQERVYAPNDLQARAKIDHEKYRVEAVVSIDKDQPSDKATPAGGRAIECAAIVAACLTWLFLPCVVAALILAGMTMQESNGKRGGFALTISALAVILWVVAVAVYVVSHLPK